jgi:hypothetical protein
VSNKTKRQGIDIVMAIDVRKYAGQGFETQPNGSTERVAADFVGERPNGIGLVVYASSIQKLQ